VDLALAGLDQPSAPAAAEALTPLSPQELQVGRLAAQGLSNREIAQRLSLSHRTVGSHLYRIFPKLGIRSRGQLHLVLAGGADGDG
jgi:DNA-binding NarL/FixJ family response regulator